MFHSRLIVTNHWSDLFQLSTRFTSVTVVSREPNRVQQVLRFIRLRPTVSIFKLIGFDVSMFLCPSRYCYLSPQKRRCDAHLVRKHDNILVLGRARHRLVIPGGESTTMKIIAGTDECLWQILGVLNGGQTGLPLSFRSRCLEIDWSIGIPLESICPFAFVHICPRFMTNLRAYVHGGKGYWTARVFYRLKFWTGKKYLMNT